MGEAGCEDASLGGGAGGENARVAGGAGGGAPRRGAGPRLISRRPSGALRGLNTSGNSISQWNGATGYGPDRCCRALLESGQEAIHASRLPDGGIDRRSELLLQFVRKPFCPLLRLHGEQDTEIDRRGCSGRLRGLQGDRQSVRHLYFEAHHRLVDRADLLDIERRVAEALAPRHRSGFPSCPGTFRGRDGAARRAREPSSSRGRALRRESGCGLRRKGGRRAASGRSGAPGRWRPDGSSECRRGGLRGPCRWRPGTHARTRRARREPARPVPSKPPPGTRGFFSGVWADAHPKVRRGAGARKGVGGGQPGSISFPRIIQGVWPSVALGSFRAKRRALPAGRIPATADGPGGLAGLRPR